MGGGEQAERRAAAQRRMRRKAFGMKGENKRFEPKPNPISPRSAPHGQWSEAEDLVPRK